MAVASLTYDSGHSVEETKNGFFVYDGSPARFHEWEFRAEIRFHSAKDDEKNRALSSIVEALRGEAALVAMDVGMKKLMHPNGKGFEELVNAMSKTVFPQAQAEAKELYQVGHKHRGPLSRQSAEPMISYVSRRRRWWAKLKRLDPTVDLSPSLLGDLMLDAANLGKVEKLLVLTSTGNNREFDKIAEALMKQHAKIHVDEKKEKRHDNHHKSGFKKPWTRHANMADAEAEVDEDYDYDQEGDAPVDQSAPDEVEDDKECETVEEVEMDVFTCLLAQGFEPEATVTLIQSEAHAFMAGKGQGKGKRKGKVKGKFNKKRFSSGIKPHLSLKERQDALTKLKGETQCRGCGEYGHWEYDPKCPKMQKNQKTSMLSLVTAYSHKAGCSSSSCSHCDTPAVPWMEDMPTVTMITAANLDEAVPRFEDVQDEQSSEVEQDSGNSAVGWANFAVQAGNSDAEQDEDEVHEDVVYLAPSKAPPPKPPSMPRTQTMATQTGSASKAPPPQPPQATPAKSESDSSGPPSLVDSSEDDARPPHAFMAVRAPTDFNMVHSIACDKKMVYGEHKGKLYTEICDNHPEYVAELRGMISRKKDVPKYVSEFIRWVEAETTLAADIPTRSRKGLPERKPQPCADGCTEFTRKGSNAYITMYTCLVCGHGDSHERNEDPSHVPEDCPHDLLDHRGSTRKVMMTYCKQCCTFVDMRDRRKVKEFAPTSNKLTIASTDQQKLARNILEERSLDAKAVRTCLSVFNAKLTVYFEEHESISSTQMRLLLDDAFDAVSAQKVHLLSKESSSSTAYMAMGPSNDANCSKKSRVLPEVDIMEDPGIWICLDEGCNSNCHGDEWAENAEKKLKKMTQIRENKLAWIHRRERSFNGIGDAKVITYGKRSVPAAWMLQKSRKILPGFLESHEQKGHHPLLLSDES